MRSIWKGSLGFGMVAIPVKLYTATEDKDLNLLHNLHGECKTPLKQPKKCPKCDREVSAEEIIKGFMLDKEHYVPITPQELEGIKLESCHSIDVVGFTSADLIADPRWTAGKDAYYLSPDEAGGKAFVLFLKAMEASGVVAISKLAVRSKEQLIAVRPFNGILLVQALHWADEIKDYSELMISLPISDKEMQMAGMLIKAMTKEIKLADFKDEYRASLKSLIEAKLAGQVIEAPQPKPATDDLADALMKSLEAMGAQA